MHCNKVAQVWLDSGSVDLAELTRENYSKSSSQHGGLTDSKTDHKWRLLLNYFYIHTVLVFGYTHQGILRIRP